MIYGEINWVSVPGGCLVGTHYGVDSIKCYDHYLSTISKYESLELKLGTIETVIFSLMSRRIGYTEFSKYFEIKE